MKSVTLFGYSNRPNSYLMMTVEANIDLLRIFAHEKSSQRGEKAFNEFYDRFKKYVWAICYKVTSNTVNKNILAQDIFLKTFEIIYAKAESFDASKCSTKIDNCIKAWIGRIVVNVYRREAVAYWKQSALSYIEDTPEVLDIAEEYNHDYIDEPSAEMKIFLEAQGLLNKKEKSILLAYFNCSIDGKSLPPEVRDSLCYEFGMLRDSLRQTKKRALDKIKRYIRTNYPASINSKI